MTKTDFHALIDKIVEARPGTIQGNEKLAELSGWDSLAVVAFISGFDKAFGSPPPADALMECKTVADLAALAGDRIQG